MEITRRCDYAIRILRCAYHHRDEYISIAEVAEEEDIPYAFARTIQHDLSMAGYIKTVRGAHGGLTLAIDPSKVTLADMLTKLQGQIATAPCSADPSICPQSKNCTMNKVWIAADNVLDTLLSSLTLQQVFDGDGKGKFVEPVEKKANDAANAAVSDILTGGARHECAQAVKQSRKAV